VTQERNAAVAVVGAGDFIGAAICEKFAAEGYRVFGGRRRGDELDPLKASPPLAAVSRDARSMPARKRRSHPSWTGPTPSSRSRR